MSRRGLAHESRRIGTSMDALTIPCLDFCSSRRTSNRAQHHKDITIQCKSLEPSSASSNLTFDLQAVCLADAELRHVTAISPLEAACRQAVAVLTTNSGMALYALGSAATPQPHDIAGHVLLALRRMQAHAYPSPTHFSILDQQWSHDSQSFPRSIPDSARVLVAHADGAAPQRTVPRCCRLSGAGPARESKTRHAQHTTRLGF